MSEPTETGRKFTDAERKSLNAEAMSRVVYKQSEIAREAIAYIHTLTVRYSDEEEFWKGLRELGLTDQLILEFAVINKEFKIPEGM